MRTTVPKPGDERIKSWFALLPVTINRERRWLERVTVKQRYCHYAAGHYYWRNIEFIDDPPDREYQSMTEPFIAELYRQPDNGKKFFVDCHRPAEAAHAVNRQYPVGTHRGGFIYERISATPSDYHNGYTVTLTYSGKFEHRCQYAGRPIVLPRETT